MKKRIASLFLALVLCVGLAVPAFADDVESVWNGDFSSLFTVTVNFHSSWGLYNDQYYIMTITGYRGTDTSIVIPSVDASGDPIQAIYDEAFKDNTSLVSVTVPSGITSIGSDAFSGCSSLTTVNLPDTLVRIGDRAFTNCTSLTSVTLPGSLAEIGRSTFGFCRNLPSIVIPDGVSQIGYGAFFGCTSLTTVTIPASVTSIDFNAFGECSSLTDVYYGGTAAQWAAINIVNQDQSNDPLLKANIHFSSSAPVLVGGFTDVTGDAYFADPVQWAVDEGITTGTSATTFSPNDTCTRGQIITFLWRAAGSPEPQGAVTVSDVTAADYYGKAVQWAAENGMFEGNTFSPNADCTRAMAVEFMWKYAGSPSADSPSFSDVTAGDSFATAVGWALAEGITTGVSATSFSPSTTCTRGQIVTFLYRGFAE